MQTQVLQRCNLENSSFVSDSEMLQMLNASAAELYEILVHKFEDYYLSEFYFVVAPGVSSYSLPSDLFKLSALDISAPDGYWPVEQWTKPQRSKVQRTVPYVYNRPKYRIQGNVLRFMPPAYAAGTYRLWYVPRLIPATSLTSALDSSMEMQNWYEYIVVDTCIKVAQKEESDINVFAGQKMELKDRISRHAASRDQGSAYYLTSNSSMYDDDLEYGRYR